MTTTIANAFTGYDATIHTTGTPAISTIKKHLRKSKASGCMSITLIEIDGQLMELVDLGDGAQLVAR